MNSPEVNPAPQADAAQMEQEVINRCHRMMRATSITDPTWFARYEDVFPDTAPRGEVVGLMAGAPDQFSLGVLFGKFLMRQEIAAMTGREFE